MIVTTTEFAQALALPVSAISYHVTQLLQQRLEGRGLLRTEQYFGLESYAWEKHCELKTLSEVTPEFDQHYRGPEHPVSRGATQALFHVCWRGEELDVVRLQWEKGLCSTETVHWIVARDEEVATTFFKAVMDHGNQVKDEILVFNGGSFSKDDELYRDIQGSRLENLVLAGSLKEDLAADCALFFESREMYQRYGVPWKRGYLLLGPPGNGKSHTVKALVNHLKKPCIYVQSFKSQHATDHSVMRSLFERARVTTPCIVVLEDLDSLLNDGNRSFFLNELDGFASNHGILAIATTNHPERLDPAILERPSRFDRKYTFTLPEPSERRSYLGLWNDRLEADLRLSPAGLETVVSATDSFSYAYLKELVLSSMMAWMRAPGTRSMDALMGELVSPLREQLRKPEEPRAVYGDEDADDMLGMLPSFR